MCVTLFMFSLPAQERTFLFVTNLTLSLVRKTDDD